MGSFQTHLQHVPSGRGSQSYEGMRALSQHTPAEHPGAEGQDVPSDYEAAKAACKAAKLAAARLHMSIMKEANCNVEKSSVYGAAVVMPQFARSAGWPPKLCVLAIRSYVFLFLNCFLQWFLVYSLMKEELVMDKFAGQMYLCDFGAVKAGCPEADGCIGPGGTRFTPSRMYSYAQWNVQNFVKDALKELWPEKSAEIDDKVDPGEYGLESSHCRFLCTFLFIVAVTQEFQKALELLRLLYVVPSRAETWILEEKEEVHLCVRGMPRHWKMINFLAVFLPKLFLWQFTCRTGFMFLLETAGIQDTIVNSTALTFILNIDELLFDTLSTTATRDMLEMVEGIPLRPDQFKDDDGLSDEAILQKAGMNRWFGRTSIPQTGLLCLVWWFYFLWVYYSSYCHMSEDGVRISNDMFRPKTTYFSHLTAFLPQTFPIPSEEQPFWTMPEEKR